MRSVSVVWFLVTALIPVGGCVEEMIRDIGGSKLEATFRVQDETFRVRVTDPDAIEDLIDVWQRVSSATIPNGVLRAGPGEDDHNAPWSWHLDPEDIEMAEVTVEVCDGKPSDVEADVNYWLTDVGRYCPWSAELIHLRPVD